MGLSGPVTAAGAVMGKEGQGARVSGSADSALLTWEDMWGNPLDVRRNPLDARLQTRLYSPLCHLELIKMGEPVIPFLGLSPNVYRNKGFHLD